MTQQNKHKLPPKAWIMVAGPYSSGTSNVIQKQNNLDILNQAALSLFNLGYIPIVGVNCALPLIHASDAPDSFNHIMMPLSLALSERCDACFRVGGTSKGADREVERFRAAGKPVFLSLDEISTWSG